MEVEESSKSGISKSINVQFLRLFHRTNVFTNLLHSVRTLYFPLEPLWDVSHDRVQPTKDDNYEIRKEFFLDIFSLSSLPPHPQKKPKVMARRMPRGIDTETRSVAAAPLLGELVG